MTDGSLNPPQAEGCKASSLSGMASFSIALFSWLALFALIALIGVITSMKPGFFDDSGSPQSMLAGLFFIVCMLLNAVGWALALPGMFSPSAHRLYSVIGFALNGLTFLGEGALLLCCCVF